MWVYTLPMKRIKITAKTLVNIAYYATVLLLITGAFLFVNKLIKSNARLKLNQIELKSTQYKLNELNKQYDSVLQQKANSDAEKAAQDAKIQELEQEKIKLQNELQSKLDKQQQIAVLNSQKAYADSFSGQDAKMWIYMHESGNNPLARNYLGCLGIGQACPGSKLLAVCPTLEYNCEDAFFTNYMLARYGTWQNAMYFWQANHYW